MNFALANFSSLITANPILRRVVETAGKRKRDLVVRCGYLGLLVMLVCLSLFSASGGGGSLSALATASREIFREMSMVQLGLVSLLAPVLTAGAITQEKDSQTYDILLTTPLSNAQIVLGTLMSRLFFIIALLISGIPVFAVTQIFGGVLIHSIVLSFAIATATAVVTGALAMAIATFKVGTRRTIFSFYLFIAIYLIGGFMLDKLPALHPTLLVTSASPQAQTSWLTGINPFLALRTLTSNKYLPPTFGQLPESLRGWPISTYLTDPVSFYVDFMLLLSAVLVIPSTLLLRRMAQSTLSFRGWLLRKLHIARQDQTKKPRAVWNNPIAWREAKTKASATRATLLRYGFTIIGIAGAIVLLVIYASPTPPPAKSISPGSYNPTAQTLFIHGDTTYGVSADATFILNNNPVNAEVLNGNYVVDNIGSKLVNGSKWLTQLNLSDIPKRIDPIQVRQFILGGVVLEFAVILLIVTNAAASAVTREKEDGTLDLLLSTPITSRYYLWGKLRGLVSFVLPLVAVPVASALLFIIYDIFELIFNPSAIQNFQWIVFPEALLLIPVTIVIVVAFASIVGMQMSLRCRTTVRAVMSSVAIVLGVCGILVGCGTGSLDTHGTGDSMINIGFASFSPFTLISLLIDPYQYDLAPYTNLANGDLITARVTVTIFGVVAVAVYALIVFAMYNSMVKNFDMTIRRQQR